MNNWKIYTLAALALLALACQPQNHEPQTQTEWIERADGFQDRYALEQLVVLSRHNIRSPMVSKKSVLTRLTNSDYQWYPWEGAPSTLTPRGERLEKKMGAFFREWLEKKDFLSHYSADNQAFRFYSNAKQRCIKTSQSFSGALLPGKNPQIETHVPFDTMDPVFTPQITKLSDDFINRARQEVQDWYGDFDESLSDEYALLEDVIDITASPAYPDTASLSQFPSSISYTLNAEPAMAGGLKMACSLSDALTLQYYEEPDEKKAAFGHSLSFDEWTSIASIKEMYEMVLFCVPSVAVNVAHPLLQVILEETQNEERLFTLLCGHDSNIASVMTALQAELPELPASVDQITPIGGKLIFERFLGKDKVQYADILLVYASAEQLRQESDLSYSRPPMAVKVKLKGLQENADGLYSLSDVQQRLLKAIQAYDSL